MEKRIRISNGRLKEMNFSLLPNSILKLYKDAEPIQKPLIILEKELIKKGRKPKVK